METLAKNIKQLRLKNNMTQQQLASKLDLTKSVISAYETGLRQPSYDVLINLARYFNVSSDFLLGIDINNTCDLSGLTTEEQNAINNLINSLKHRQ